MFLEESLYVVEAARLALHSDECLRAGVSKSRDRDCILVRNVHGSCLLAIWMMAFVCFKY